MILRVDDFAVALENIPKIVFSRTLDKVEWKKVKLAKENPEEAPLDLFTILNLSHSINE